MSAGARTNDTAMNSTPAAAIVSASTRSSSVGVAQPRALGRAGGRRGGPVPVRRSRPRRRADVGSTSLDPQRDRPVADDHSIADREVVEQRRVVDADHVGVARPVADLEADHRSRRRAGRPASGTLRRGSSVRAGRPARRSACRPSIATAAHRVEPVEVLLDGPWLRLSRTTSTPARSTAIERFVGASLAGPSVATIFVRRVTPGAPGSSGGESYLLI